MPTVAGGLLAPWSPRRLQQTEGPSPQFPPEMVRTMALQVLCTLLETHPGFSGDKTRATGSCIPYAS